MAKGTRKTRTTSKDIDEAARLAAEEAALELEEESNLNFEDENFDPHDFPVTFSENSVDVFEEGFKACLKLHDSPKFHIKRNSEFLCVKGWPYSWEMLQKEYGPGYYQIIAKRQSNGQIVKKQSESVGDPNMGKDVKEDHSQEKTNNDMGILAMMQQIQERAELRLKEESRNSENAMALMMKTVAESQSQTTQLMMTMMQESNRQFQTMLTTLLTNKPDTSKSEDKYIGLITTMLTKKESGLDQNAVLKMVWDAETRAEQRTVRNFEYMEKKAEALAELKADALGGDDKPQTLTSQLLPVLAQLMAGNQAQRPQLQEAPPRPTPEQMVDERIRRERMANGQRSGSLEQGFVERPAARQATPPPRPSAKKNPTTANPSQANVQNTASIPKDMIFNDRQKEQLFELVAPMIGNAMLQGEKASETALKVLQHLESQGVPRQNVAKSFTLEDFYRYAAKYGAGEEAKPLLKEFHEAIQESVKSEGAGDVGGRPPQDDGQSASNGAGGSVAPIRSAPTSGRARREPAPVTANQ